MLNDEVRELRARFEKKGQGHLFHNLMLFSRILREMGLDANPTRTIDMARSLEFIGLGNKDDFRDAAKAIMLRRNEEEPIFDYVFQMFWRRWPSLDDKNADAEAPDLPPRYVDQKQDNQKGPKSETPPPEMNNDKNDQKSADQDNTISKRLADEGQGEDSGEGEDEDSDKQQTYSAAETFMNKDFQDFSKDELEEAKRLMSELRWSLPYHQTRRLQASRRGKRLDARRVVRKSLKYGGVPVELAWRKRKWKPRPLVLICDISGSMDLYSRLLLQFMHSMENNLRMVETFVFGTRLTRITHELKNKNVDDALFNVSKIVKDWSGGTKIGESLETFNLKWARRVLGHGAVVIIISDGWDRGSVETLRREMARLQRLSFRLIWLNPLLGLPDYQPLTVGIQAALDYVDDFLPCHNFRSLQQLAVLLSEIQKESRAERRQQLLVK
ncbi:MAG TPA: VWA domain-containing protein [Chloroflexia bacterium]|nr:VWA domain-containing protein [Chloroflexia bacterium]